MTQVIAFDVGIKNLAYCIFDNNELKSIDKVDLQCSKKDYQKLIDAVIELMDSILFTQLDVNRPIVILIESQMTSVMRCIQTVINTYFKVTGKYNSLDVVTKYLSAKHKLNLIEKFKDEYKLPDTNLKSSKYQQNKVDSVNFGKWLLENKYKNEDILNKLKGSKKIDDEMDALLMCVYYIKN